MLTTLMLMLINAFPLPPFPGFWLPLFIISKLPSNFLNQGVLLITAAADSLFTGLAEEDINSAATADHGFMSEAADGPIGEDNGAANLKTSDDR